jgi:uncharacterized surface protein with fasciclin (FAS1) repeats
VSLVKQAGLTSQMEQSGITILAPINQAWQDLRANPGGSVLDDPAQLSALLLRHVINEALTIDQIFERSSLTTAGGATLVVDGGARTIDGAQIVNADNISADGSVTHWVDPVILGPG